MNLEHVEPKDIEKRSFAIISEELKEQQIFLEEEKAPVIKRVIHTTADFSYASTLLFSKNALNAAYDAFKAKASLVTDTKMALAGINKKAAGEIGLSLYNFMDDASVAEEAKQRGVTRSAICMERATALKGPVIYVVGNAPTALIRIRELYDEKKITPALVIGVPVGFVNVVQSKELILETDMNYIVARGRKGGSNVAAAICNALMYEFIKV